MSEMSEDNPAGPFVYVIAASDQAMKIGVAGDVESRLSGIQTGSHLELRVIATYPMGSELQARSVEASAHRWLKHEGIHVRQEWFLLDEIKARDAIERSINGEGGPRNERTAVTVRLPPELVDWLRAQPDSQSALIQRALERERNG